MYHQNTLEIFSPQYVDMLAVPIGLFQVGSPAGYASRCALYLMRMRPGMAKAADFPSPVAVQKSKS